MLQRAAKFASYSTCQVVPALGTNRRLIGGQPDRGLAPTRQTYTIATQVALADPVRNIPHATPSARWTFGLTFHQLKVDELIGIRLKT